MNTLLQINTSIHADHGQSSQLATQFVQAFSRARPDWRIVRRDLASDTVPHLSAERFAAFVSAPQGSARWSPIPMRSSASSNRPT